jgi:hypothetical protein
VAGCLALLQGSSVDPDLIYVLGGPPARWAIDGGVSGPDYWLRVWAARGLLYAYDPSAAPAVVNALSDEHWRVREAAANVCARHRIDLALPALVALVADPRLRVRAAAERAVMRITDGN